MRPLGLILAGLALVATGCEKRSTPYRFRAPVLAAVRADELPPAVRTAPAQRREQQRRAAIAAVPPAALGPPPVPDPARAPVTTMIRTELGDPREETLRSLVGRRELEATDLDFARAALETALVPLADELRAVRSGADLLALAQERGARVDETQPRLGDLILFDEVSAGEAASLVGVVVTVDARQTIEFVYLARGVVRRGFANLARPSGQRDQDGRILNTFVRHLDGAPPAGAKFLAGELFGGIIRPW